MDIDERFEALVEELDAGPALDLMRQWYLVGIMEAAQQMMGGAEPGGVYREAYAEMNGALH